MSLIINSSKNHRVLFPYVLLIIALGLILRINAAVKQSFWQDEVYIFTVSKQHTPSQLLLLEQEDKAHPQLYYLLSNLIARYDDSPLALRLPSLLSFIPALLFIYLIGATAFSRPVALMASLIFAVHPFFVNQGFQAKMYGLTYGFVLGGLFFALKGIKNQKFRWLFLSGLFNAAAFYTDYSTVWYLLSLVTAGFISSLLWKEYRRTLWKHLSLILFTTMFFISIDLPIFIKNFSEAAQGEYLGKYWYWYAQGTMIKFSGLWSLATKINDIAPRLTPSFVWLPLLLVCITVFLKCIDVLDSTAKTASTITRKNFTIFLISSYFVPVFLSYLFSILYSPIFNPSNIWISGLPFIFGMSLLFVNNKAKALTVILMIYIMTLGFASIGRWGFFGTTDWKGLTEQLRSYPGRQDLVFLDFEGPIWARTMPFVDYYLEVPPNDSLKKRVFLHPIDMNKPIDMHLVGELSKLNNLWLLSNGENVENLLYREINKQIVTEFQKFLRCQGKPCEQIFIIHRD